MGPAAVAVEAREAVAEHAALEAAPELRLDEGRHADTDPLGSRRT